VVKVTSEILYSNQLLIRYTGKRLIQKLLLFHLEPLFSLVNI